MALSYNAFISYRHHPDDIRVAGEIHRSLERFHIPGSLKKKTKKISRLFRDKEELPITSNLSDDIDLALSNSDYLIVICSVHTKESVWVQREIELFLKTHDRDHVLTVLASGEPYDVIPEILLYETVVDPVTGESRRIEYEPLSCDWRMKLRKAKQEELPRLAAALLGCGYDELRQRQKQYRTRRLVTAVSSVAVASTCLAAYFLHTSITIARANEQIRLANIQIRENLEEALTNQSRHLATAARERLEDGDRLTALSLAVAALPGEGNERPYVPEAEVVLNDALGIYNTVTRLTAVGTVTPGLNVELQRFWISPSEKYLYILDNRSVLSVWGLENLEKVGAYTPGEGYFSDLRVLPNDNILFQGGEFGTLLSCIMPDGEVIWERDDCFDLTMEAGGTPVILSMDSAKAYSLLRLDPETGKALGQGLSLPVFGLDMTPRRVFAEETLPDVPVPIRYYTFGTAAVYTADWETGEILPADLGTTYPECLKMTENGRYYYLGEAQGLGISGLYGSDRVNTPETRTVYCYDASSGEILWQNRITASVLGDMNLEFLPGGRLLCQLGNVFQVMDMETGETLGQCHAGSAVMAMAVEEKNITALLQDGYVCYYWFDANYTYEVKFARNDVSMGRVGENLYLQHENGDHVTVYRNVSPDPEWILPVQQEMSFQLQILRDHYLACQDSRNLYLFDLASRELVWTGEYRNGGLLDFSEDGSTLYYINDTGYLMAVDIATGKTKEQVLSDEGGILVRGSTLLRFGRLYYLIEGVDNQILACLDLDTGAYQLHDLVLPERFRELFASWQVLEAEGDHVWLWAHEQLLLELDTRTGEYRILAEETTQKPAVAVDGETGRVALANGGGISLRQIGGEEELFLALEGASAGSLHFRNEELLALCNNGVVYRFGADGSVLSRTVLTVGYDFAARLVDADADPRSVVWQFTPEGKLVLNLRGEGSIIDCDTWGVTAGVSYFLLWEEGSDTLVCSLTDCLAGFPLYETGELLELARQELGSFTLTQEQRSAYGID